MSLGPALVGARVLDAFAGTGALGLEALSRGAAFAVFLENQAPAIEALKRNVAAFGVEAETRILRGDALHPPRPEAPADIVLMDPPYNQGLAEPALSALAAAGWLADDALATVELMKSEPFAPPAGFTAVDDRHYGKARLVFLRWEGS